MRKRLFFRTWFYFRTGWSVYFTFILSAVNTLTVTSYLAIERSDIIKGIFPSFTHYIITAILAGIPILICVGYIHYKRSDAIRAEADIGFEANPHMYRMLANTEIIMPVYLKMSEILLKLTNNEKMTESEIKEITDIQKELSAHMKNKTIDKLHKAKKF